MGRPRATQPELRRQPGSKRADGTRAPDRAFTVVRGKREYLGQWGTSESEARYYALLAELKAGLKPLASASESAGDSITSVTIKFLVARYIEHLEARHAQGRLQRPELFRVALGVLVQHYGPMPAREFQPKHLVALQQVFVDRGWRSQTVNDRVAQIRRVFRWGANRGYAAYDQAKLLELVEPVERSLEDDTDGVQPVALAHVAAIEPYVSRQVWAMIQVQLTTGARPGEVCIMRSMDIDTSETPWIYRPSTHKNKRKGQSRNVLLGPRAQDAIRPFLAQYSPQASLFSPREAEKERLKLLHAERKTPIGYGNSPGTNRKVRPQHQPGERYETTSYARAIARACKRADIPRWSPNQLRHTFATETRKQHGIEVAQVLLGHARIGTTQIYAKPNWDKAREVARRAG